MSIEFSQDKKELSQKEVKEILEKLEEIPCFTDQDIFIIALVYLGIKPAGEAELPFYEFDDYDFDAYEADVEKICTVLSRLGLKFEYDSVDSDLEDEYPMTWTSFYFGKSVQIARQLKEASFAENRTLFATILGYPQTAIAAFTHDSLPMKLPDEIKSLEEIAFLYFRPSKDNWRQEIEILKPQILAVKALFPSLYNRMLRNHKNNLQD